jgi:hypothetical protein
LLVFVLMTLQALVKLAVPARELPYGEFERELNNGNVTDLQVLPDRIDGTLRAPQGRTRFRTTRVDPALAGKLDHQGSAPAAP